MFYIDIKKETVRRYAPEKFMSFEQRLENNGHQGGVYDVLDSYMFSAIEKLPMAGTYLIVEDEGNPPLISFNLYGQTEFWWMLMTYNSLTSPMQLQAGMSIRYPILSDLEALYAKLAAKERQVGSKRISATTPHVSSAIGNPDSLNRVIPTGDGNTNAMLLRAYASFAAQKYNLAFAIIDDYQTLEGINVAESRGLEHVPYKATLSVVSNTAPVITTTTHSLLNAANANALHIAMLPDTEGLKIEYSFNGGESWQTFSGGLIFTQGGEYITLRFTYNPTTQAPTSRTFNGYVIVHD